jgi:hypothetical protein
MLTFLTAAVICLAVASWLQLLFGRPPDLRVAPLSGNSAASTVKQCLPIRKPTF